MRRFRSAVIAGFLLCGLLPQAAGASQPATRGILPPSARPLGYSLTELATAWNIWAFGTAADVNPLLAVRCEQSSLDHRIWFLPVSLGGEYQDTCNVPQGTFLVFNPGGSECSNMEPEPFFGVDEADLLACVNETFGLLTYLEITFNGTTVKDLDSYIVTTPLTHLPANNLLGPDPALSRDKGFFLVIAPLSRGTHTLHAYDEFFDGAFKAGITYTINVH
jgi:hypothetical protein